MATRKVTAAADEKTDPKLVKYEKLGQQKLAPFQKALQDLEITDDESYAAADELLASARRELRGWEDMMEEVLEPLRKAKTAADKVKAKVGKPLADFIDALRRQMGDFQRQKAIAAAAEQRKRDAEAEELRRKQEEAAAKLAAAAPGSKKAQILERTVDALAEAVEEAEAPVATTTKAEHSAVRRIKQWRIAGSSTGDPTKDKQPNHVQLMRIIKAVAAGKVPLEVITLDYSVINRQRLDDITVIADWEGFEVYEDVLVTGRG
jgi:hypothetical protein